MEKGFFPPLPVDKGAAVPGKGAAWRRRHTSAGIADGEDTAAMAPTPAATAARPAVSSETLSIHTSPHVHTHRYAFTSIAQREFA